MATPSPRNKILPARGLYADLSVSLADLLEGEICYATDEDQYYQKEGGILVAVGATKAQGLLADSAVQPGDNVSDLNNDAGYITLAEVPADVVTSVAGKTGDVVLVKADVGLGNVDNTSDADKPVSTAQQTALDAKADLVGGVIPTSQIPAIAITEFLGSVGSEAAMLALIGQPGDWCLRTDKAVGYVIVGADPSLIANWEAFTVPGSAVTTINTQVGDVVLGAADVGAATAAQGALADSAIQPGDNISTLTNDAGYITSPDGGNADTLDGQEGSYYLDYNNFTNTNWSRSGTDLSPSTSGDNITDIGDITTKGSSTISTASGTLTLTTDSNAIFVTPGGAANTNIGTYEDGSNNQVIFRSGSPGAQYQFFNMDNTFAGRFLFKASTDPNGLTGTRSYTWPDKGGTVALTNDISWTKSGTNLYPSNIGDNVGIGTSNPDVSLHVSGDARFGEATGAAFIDVGFGATEDRNAFIDLIGDTTYTGYGLRLIRTGEGANGRSRLVHRGTGDLNINCSEAGEISFDTDGFERLRIDSSGRLLLGTSSSRSNYLFGVTAIAPRYQIESSGGDTAVGITRNSPNGNGPSIYLGKSRGSAVGSNTAVASGDRLGSLSFNGADGSNLVQAARIDAEVDGTPDTNDMPGRLVFLTTADGASSTTERMRIDSNGNVGIGTTSPNEPLHIASTTPTILLEDTSGATAGIERTAFVRVNDSLFIQSRGNDNAGVSVDYRIDYNSSGASSHQWRIGNSEKVRIDSSGNVGIGTSDPATKLHVYHASGSPTLTVQSGSVSGRFLTNDAGVYVGTTTNNDFNIQTNSQSRVFVKNTGNVGIGTSNPGVKLEVNGTIKATDINFTGLSTFADDSAAGTGGLTAGDVYKTSTGELRIKL